MDKKAYSRLSMITKLKYAGVSRADLIVIYILFIRSVTEYCAVAFHSSLTQEQTRKLETIQKTCLKVILGESYIDYPSALVTCGLKTLSDRRRDRCLNFALKAARHPRNNRIFPQNQNPKNKTRLSNIVISDHILELVILQCLAMFSISNKY